MNTDPGHPLWLIIKTLILFMFMVLFAYTNANNFDSTEVKMLTEIAFILFGTAVLESYFRKKH